MYLTERFTRDKTYKALPYISLVYMTIYDDMPHPAGDECLSDHARRAGASTKVQLDIGSLGTIIESLNMFWLVAAALQMCSGPSAGLVVWTSVGISQIRGSTHAWAIDSTV